MLLELTLFLAVLFLVLRYSRRWIGMFREQIEERERKQLAATLDWTKSNDHTTRGRKSGMFRR